MIDIILVISLQQLALGGMSVILFSVLSVSHSDEVTYNKRICRGSFFLFFDRKVQSAFWLSPKTACFKNLALKPNS